MAERTIAPILLPPGVEENGHSEVAYRPDISHLITEDDTPVDNTFSEKQQRFLVEPLYTTWAGGSDRRKFRASANVGIFSRAVNPAIVPDMFLSLDVGTPADMWAKENRSYLIWEYGKPPDVVVEVVSNLEGNEAGRKLRIYARMGVAYYIIFDPQKLLSDQLLRLFKLDDDKYISSPMNSLAEIGLSLVLWEGVFEQVQTLWLRWADAAGNLILTGAELAEQEHTRARQEHARAEQEHARAEQEHARAEQERVRAERLAAQLKALGIEPD